MSDREARDRSILEAFVGGATFAQLGKQAGISHERARQIVIREIGGRAFAEHMADRAQARAARAAEATKCACGAQKNRRSTRCASCAYDTRAAETGTSRWTRAKIIERAREWHDTYGVAPSASSWNPSRLRADGMHGRADVFDRGHWPKLRNVQHHFGSFSAMIAAAGLTPAKTGPAGHGKQPGSRCVS